MKKVWLRHCLTLVLLLSMCLVATAQTVERVRYFINDASGSPVMVLGPDGSILARYAYSPFGAQATAQNAARQRLGFVGGLKETPGLHYLKHRYYNPLLGRFYQPDPVGFLDRGPSQINRYGYGVNDPYTYRDKDGRQFNQLSDDVLSNLRLSGNNDLLSFQWLQQVFAGTINSADNKQLNNEFLKSYVEGQKNFAMSGGALMLLVPGGEFGALADTPRVFWSGGAVARSAAETWAAANGAKTLEMTAQGQALMRLTTGMDWSQARSLWVSASRDFAGGASGGVNVFQSASGVSLQSVWREVEYQLLKDGRINYHVVMPDGGVVKIR